MLYTIAVILIVLWLLGLVSSYTIGGFIHVLLVIAIVMVLLRIISGRRPAVVLRRNSGRKPSLILAPGRSRFLTCVSKQFKDSIISPRQSGVLWFFRNL